MIVRVGLLVLSFGLALGSYGATVAAMMGGDFSTWVLTCVLPLLWVASVAANYRVGRLGPCALTIGATPALIGVGILALAYCASRFGAYV